MGRTRPLSLGTPEDSSDLDPAADHRRGFDAVDMLSVFLVLLYAIPSSLTVSALGSAGRPANLWGLVCAVWWLWTKVQRPAAGRTPRQPVRVAVLVFVCLVLVSYAVAQTRGLPAVEASQADNGLLRAFSYAGIVLVAGDGIRSWERLRVLLVRFAAVGGLMGLLGLAQFVTGQSLLASIEIPGLTLDAASDALQTRNGFQRVNGTASHPLEYAVVLVGALPVALTLLIAAPRRVWRWVTVVAILLSSLFSVSRAAVIGATVAVLVMVPGWSPRVRRWAVGAGLLLVVGVNVAVPGILATIRGLLDPSGDASTASRTNSYDVAFDIAGRFAVVGRGFGTFLPSYRILDNQYLGMLIELGVLGVAAFLGVIVTAVVTALRARRALSGTLERSLCVALVAGIVAVALLFAFFDALAFPQAGGTLFLLVGLAGALPNLRPTPAATPHPPAPPVGTDAPRASRPSEPASPAPAR